MSKHTVIKRFRDLSDKDKVYEVGDAYPSPANKKISNERYEELLGKGNKLGAPVIKKNEEQE